MKTIGLTGGIGSGKSTVARMLRQMGYPVYIADKEASRLMNTHPEIRKELQQRFGAATYTARGTVDKPKMAQLVFNATQALADLNRIVHPRVMEDFRQWSQQQNSILVFFESAILFEAGLDRFFQSVICVSAPESLRISRVVERDRTTSDKVEERLRNQSDETLKCQKADFVIHNDRNRMILEQLLNILQKLQDTEHHKQ
ncbi:MAG: dephospho-CoA kinase [Odoribacter sp.]|nr:dephospho-CoA kinase [Odoribacter sp.]